MLTYKHSSLVERDPATVEVIGANPIVSQKVNKTWTVFFVSVAKWLTASDCKSEGRNSLVGSNPTADFFTNAK